MLASRLVHWGAVWACFFAVLGQCRAADAAQEADALFRSPNLLRIRIDIPDAGMQQLDQGYMRHPRTRAAARVTEAGVVYSNGRVQLKGRGTYQSIDRRPSLTLHFDKDSEGQSFHGLRKLSLNNASQDPTCLQEKFARELFAAAGVPVARAQPVFLTLNGRDLGVYVMTEGYDKTFLKRFFKDVSGPFYDGGLFTDIDQELEVVSGSKTNHAGLRRAWLATLERDENARFAAIERAVDLDLFLSFIAMETIVCHFDGYAMRGTNYRIYHDPERDKLVFLPQGMDRVMGNYRQHLDLPVVPPMIGAVARALLDTKRGRELYIDRVRALFERHFNPDDLVRKVREWDRTIAPEMKETTRRWGVNPGGIATVPVSSLGDHQKDVDDLCERIRTRAALLESYLHDAATLAAVTPVVDFGTTNVVYLTNWLPRAAYLKPEAKWELVKVDGTNYWHLQASGSYAALGCRVRVPSGNYAMSGRVKAAGEGSPPRVMLRHFFMPFTRETQPVEWQRVNSSFSISTGAAPQEIDLLWEIRGPGEVWIEPDSFRMRKRSPSSAP